MRSRAFSAGSSDLATRHGSVRPSGIGALVALVVATTAPERAREPLQNVEVAALSVPDLRCRDRDLDSVVPEFGDRFSPVLNAGVVRSEATLASALDLLVRNATYQPGVVDPNLAEQMWRA